MTVSEETGKVLVHDRAGCSTTKVMKALGMTLKDLNAMLADVDNAHTTSSTDALPDDTKIADLGTELAGYAFALTAPEAAETMTYAAQRFGIEPEDARRLGLGHATNLGGGPRLVVPFRDRIGRPVGYQARAISKAASIRWTGPTNPDGAAWSRIGWFPGISGWQEVIVTEGPGDALTAVSVGYDALAVRGAGLVNNEANLDSVAEMLEGRVAILAGDGDDAGQQFSSRLAEALAVRGIACKILPMKKGQDLSSWRADDPQWFAQQFIKAIEALNVLSAAEAGKARWGDNPFADLGGAKYLRAKLDAEGRPIRFTDAVGFLQLENGVWTKRADGDIRTLVQDLERDLKDIAAAAQKAGDGVRAKLAREYRDVAQTSRGIDAILKELKSVQGVRANIEDFDNHPSKLAVRNGVVDLRTGKLETHDPSLLLTRRIDFDYVPAAFAKRWDQFLTECFPGQPDMPAYLQRLVGYGITGEVDEQIFVVHYGTGSNGKSVFTEELTYIFKAITTTTPFSTFEARRGDGIPNDIAALAGARLVMAPEGNQGKLMDEALLKRVTGRDLMSARFMRREFFEFRPQFLLQMASNYRPAFKGQDEGLWRRVKLIEWRAHFTGASKDVTLPAVLEAEAEGVLAWAIQGAVQWYANGLQEPEAITAVTTDYRTQSDILVDFISAEMGTVYTVGDTNDWEARTTMFQAFQDWAEMENHQDLKNWSSRAFYRALEERGFPAGKRNGVIGFKRVKKVSNNPFSEPAKMETPTTPSPTTAPDLNDLTPWDN